MDEKVYFVISQGELFAFTRSEEFDWDLTDSRPEKEWLFWIPERVPEIDGHIGQYL